MKKIFTLSLFRKLALCITMAGLTTVSHAQISYTQTPCDYAPLATTGTTLCLSDDAISEAISLGFTFQFYGTSFTSCHIGSNGFLTFNEGVSNGCCSGQLLPNAFFPNTIFFGQSDLNPNSCAYGTITYYTTGAVGNRIFVVSFTGVPHFGGVGISPVTMQLQLFENSGMIKMVTTTIPSYGNQTMGLNLNGAVADIVPGRNASMWSATNECILFTVGAPTCVPLVPTGLWSDNITNSKARLHWNVVTGVDKYAVSIYSAGALVTVKTVNVNQATIKDLLPGTTYSYKVKSICIDEGTQSAPSIAGTFTTLLRMGYQDENVTIFPNPSNGQFTLSLNGYENTALDMQILNTMGQVVYTKTIDVNGPNYSEKIALGTVAPGLYCVILTNGETNFKYSIMISE